MTYDTNKLFLDDTRQPPEGFRLAKDGEDFLHILDSTPEGFSEIWFDHDLGSVGTMTGAHCLNELINKCELSGYPKPRRIGGYALLDRRPRQGFLTFALCLYLCGALAGALGVVVQPVRGLAIGILKESVHAEVPRIADPRFLLFVENIGVDHFGHQVNVAPVRFGQLAFFRRDFKFSGVEREEGDSEIRSGDIPERLARRRAGVFFSGCFLILVGSLFQGVGYTRRRHGQRGGIVLVGTGIAFTVVGIFGPLMLWGVL